MRSYFTLLFLILFSNLATAEGDEIQGVLRGHSIQTIYLGADISARVLDFEDARLDDAFGMLPLHITHIALPSDEFSITAKIIEEESSILFASGIYEIADIDKISDAFKIFASVVYIDGMPYGQIMILPYRNPSEDQIEILQSFTVKFEINESLAPPRAPNNSFVENSVLANGSWYRLATDETGIYKISYNDLVQMGIEPSTLDPRRIRIFGNGNGIIPEKNSDERMDDLMENAIYVHGEEDGVFNEDDYILLYGQSSIKWNYVPFSGYSLFVHQINSYTDHTYYFLNFGDAPGKRIQDISYQSITPTVYVNEFSDYAVHEIDALNILKTGREWYGEIFSEFTSYDFTFNFPNISDDYQVSLMTNIAAHSTIQSHFDYYYDNQHLLEAPISKIITGTTVYAWTSTPDTVGFYPNDDEITIHMEYDRPTSTSTGWLNYIALNARRKLIFSGPDMSFRDHLSFGPGKVAEYKISGVDENLIVWDVSDPFSITAPIGTFAGDKYTFVVPAEKIREFIAFDGSEFRTIEFIEEVRNQNLHAYEPVEYIIVSHPDFMQQSQRMLSLHQGVDNMSGMIVTPQQIYNEFGSGKQDPAAIRDFVRMLYEKGDSMNKPRYLLLMGDASYDYKDRVPNNTNMVPAYKSFEALKLCY